MPSTMSEQLELYYPDRHIINEKEGKVELIIPAGEKGEFRIRS